MFYRSLIILIFLNIFFLIVFPLALLLKAQTVLPSPPKTASEDFNSGLIYGNNHAYWLTAPKGWVLDNQNGVRQGLVAVFYPKGSSWAKSQVVMYTNTSAKEEKGPEVFQKVISADVSNYRDNHRAKKILNARDIVTKDQKRKAIVKYFLGDIQGNYEACAYIDEPKVVVFVVLTARSQKQFEANLRSFKELVASYSFWTDKVDIQK